MRTAGPSLRFASSHRFHLAPLLLGLAVARPAGGLAWHDRAHLAVGQAAGYEQWYNSVGADIARLKAYAVEKPNHFFDNTNDLPITPAMVLEQADRYDVPKDPEGHVCGAPIGALREYRKALEAGRYAEFHVAYAAHYVADLCQPFHQMPYDEFNKERHLTNDAVVESVPLAELVDRIRARMVPIAIRPDRFEEDLARETARIANLTRDLAHRLRKENRDMTREEAYGQLGHAASLLKAILRGIGKNTGGGESHADRIGEADDMEVVPPASAQGVSPFREGRARSRPPLERSKHACCTGGHEHESSGTS